MSLVRRALRTAVPLRYRQKILPIRQYLRSHTGLPAHLNRDLFEQACLHAFGAIPRHIRIAAIPSYKGDGVTRMFLRFRSGRIRTIVLKDVRLSDKAFPAISGYEGGVGVPEWKVLSNVQEPLDQFLPKVLAAHELDPLNHYQYLMGDLSAGHIRAQVISDFRPLTNQLKHLQSALNSWAESTGYEATLHHDLTVADQFLSFARTSLMSFLEAYPASSVVETTLDRWDQIEETYLSLEEIGRVPHKLVHGDFHHRNVYLSTTRPVQVRAVDWEWMGIGPPHIDLASMVKRLDEVSQRKVVQQFFDHDENLGHEAHWRIFLWARLNRSLLDASLHARQNLTPLGKSPDAVSFHLKLTEAILTSMSN